MSPPVIHLDDIPTIEHLYQSGALDPHPSGLEDPAQISFPASPQVNHKISVIGGDITHVAADCIVNAANTSLLGGGGVDGAIHHAAGKELIKECRTLGGCQTGQCKMTDAYELPSKRICHTPGPVYDRSDSGESESLLRSCYTSCLEAAVKEDLKSIAFCSISTGVYGYPIYDATHIALDVTRSFVDSSRGSSLERVIFVAFSKEHKAVYEKLIPTYFPSTMGVRQGSSESSSRTQTPFPVEVEEVESESNQEVLK